MPTSLAAQRPDPATRPIRRALVRSGRVHYLLPALLIVLLGGCGGDFDDDAERTAAAADATAGVGAAGPGDPQRSPGGGRPVTTRQEPPMPASGTLAVIPETGRDVVAKVPALPAVAAKDLPVTPTPDAHVRGAWSAVRNWPLIAIHAALLNDGRVMTFGTDRNGKQTGLMSYDVWDPAAAALDQGHLTLPNGTGTDLFCSAQTLLPGSGRLFIAGGDNFVNGGTTNTANANTNLFDSASNTLTRGAEMNRPRWYSSVTTLASGDVLIQGGLSGADFPEIRRETGALSLLSTAPTGGFDYWYPRNFVGQDGRVFGFDIAGRMYFLDPQGTGSIERLDNLVTDLVGTGSSAVLYAPGKVLQIGGNTPRSAVIDFAGPLPIVTETAPLASRRFWVSGTVLPDGRVLATGGSAVDNTLDGVNNTAALWNPVTGTWTVGAGAALARLYHSTALLLPDATVLVAGGGAPGPLINTNAEIYYPPYLFDAAGRLAPRPQIAYAPASAAPGGAFTVDLGAGSAAAELVLIRAGSVTHSVNFDQRRIRLPFQPSGSTLNTRLPSNPAVIPPGFYLLFALDTAGVPSIGRMLQVTTGQATDVDADWTGRLGGHGAPAYRLECPAGEVAVGIHGSTSGTAVSSIGPRCAAVDAAGRWQGTPVNQGLAGVAAGAAVTRTCAEHSALVGLQGAADATLGSLILSCQPLVTGGRVGGVRTELAALGGGTGTARPYRGCGYEHPAYALYGTAGTAIQSLGLLCRGDVDGAGDNQPPVATSPGFQFGKVGTPTALQIVATDPEGQPLSFTATGLPPGLAIDALTGRISGTPSTTGSRSVVVGLSDGSASAAVGFNWEIFPAGSNPPVLRSPGDQDSLVGSTVQLPLQSFDPDGQSLSFSATGLPPSLAVNPATGVISGTATSIGVYAVDVAASDGAQTSRIPFNWTVRSGTAPPETCNRLSNGDFETGTAGWEIEATVALVAGGRGGSIAATVSGGWIGSRALVTADDQYDIRFHYRASGTTGWAGMGVDFLDGAGNNLGARTGTLANADTFSEYQLIVTPPPGTALMRVWVWGDPQRQLTVDDFDLRRLGCGEPPPPDVCNRIGNSGFENAATGWELNATTGLVGDARTGAAAMSLTNGWIGYRAPASPGQDITASAWFKVVGAAGWAGIGIDFLDAAGNEIEDHGGTLRETDGYSPYSLAAKAPAGTTQARVWFWADPGVTVIVDDVGLKQTGCGEVASDPCNRLSNPGFEYGLTDWEREAQTAVVGGARTGARAVTVREGWIGTRIVGVGNRQYTGQIHYQREGASGWAVMGIDYFDADGADLGESYLPLGPTQGWTPATVTGTAPAGTAFIRLWFYADGALTLTVDDADLRETLCRTPPRVDACNVLSNPGFEEGTGGWKLDAYVRMSRDSRTGSKAAQFRNGWIGALGPVEPGIPYRASAFLKTAGISGWAGLGIKWFDAAGAEISDESITLANRTRYGEDALLATSPAGAASARVWFYADAGRTLTVDDAFLRRASCTPAPD